MDTGSLWLYCYRDVTPLMDTGSLWLYCYRDVTPLMDTGSLWLYCYRDVTPLMDTGSQNISLCRIFGSQVHLHVVISKVIYYLGM